VKLAPDDLEATASPAVWWVAHWENSFFTYLQTENPRSEHSATAMLWTDPDQEHRRILHDADAMCSVRFSRGSDLAEAVIPLTDVGRLIAEGATIHGVAAPRDVPAVAWTAVAWPSYRSASAAVVARDFGGLGRLACSRAPASEAPILAKRRFEVNRRLFGSYFQSWSERSGEEAVNRRRYDAIKHLTREWGNEPPDRLAGRIVTGIRVQEIIEFYADLLPADWVISTPDGKTMRSDPAAGISRSLADRIVDALSREAYGATGPALPRARDWAQRYEIAPAPKVTTRDGKVRRFPNVVYEDTEGEALTNRPSKAHMTGDWTIRQMGPDPTGTIGSALADGTIGLAAALAAGIPTASLVARWLAAGLSDRQVQVLLATQMGATQEEIGQALRIARSTVATTASTARRKIFGSR
jgi:hypothetical protein